MYDKLNAVSHDLFRQSPEMLRVSSAAALHQPFVYTEKSDIYSLGIVLWELLTFEEPYRGLSLPYIAKAVVQEDYRPKIPSSTPADYADLLQHCWHREPSSRPTSKEIVQTLNTMIESDSSQKTPQNLQPVERSVEEITL